MIDDQLDGRERIDLGRIAAELAHGVTHCGKVDHRGDAGEILQQHASGCERDLLRWVRPWIPTRQRIDVCGGDVFAIRVPEQILKEYFQGEWQLSKIMPPAQRVEAEDLVLLRAGTQFGTCIESIRHGCTP